MRESDLDAVRVIDARCYPSPWYRSAYLTELSNRSASYIVAWEGENIVGYAGQWIIMREAHITTIAVDPTRQGRKIGERLLLALIEEAIRGRANHITLEVSESNRIAQSLYRKYGFKETALRKMYYTDTGENAVVMWANDIQHPPFQQMLAERREALETLYRQRFSQ